MFKSPYEQDRPIPKRENGYYHAKLCETSNPEIIYWTGRVWQRIGTTYTFSDDDFYYIIKNKLTL